MFVKVQWSVTNIKHWINYCNTCTSTHAAQWSVTACWRRAGERSALSTSNTCSSKSWATHARSYQHLISTSNYLINLKNSNGRGLLHHSSTVLKYTENQSNHWNFTPSTVHFYNFGVVQWFCNNLYRCLTVIKSAPAFCLLHSSETAFLRDTNDKLMISAVTLYTKFELLFKHISLIILDL